MVQCWQKELGTPSRKGYFNQEWADKMEEIGLPATGKGQKVSYSVEPGGVFDTQAEKLISTGFRVNWQSLSAVTEKAKQERQPSKVKYSCAECGLNAWAKPESALVCGNCGLGMPAEGGEEGERERWERVKKPAPPPAAPPEPAPKPAAKKTATKKTATKKTARKMVFHYSPKPGEIYCRQVKGGASVPVARDESEVTCGACRRALKQRDKIKALASKLLKREKAK
jgi:Zn finger protein HypA/HybF involved in hydrogenase expression